MSVSFACIMSKQADVGNVVRGFGLHFLLSSEESSTINPGSDDCISGTTLPPERLQLLRDISGRLYNESSNEEFLRISQSIEEQAFAHSQRLVDEAERLQEYHKIADTLTQSALQKHPAQDGEHLALENLPQSSLDPFSQSMPQVARPPIDPRFNATSPFADHTEEPQTPGQNLPHLFTLNEDWQQRPTPSTKVYGRISSMPPESGRRAGGVFANSRSISLIGARNGSVFGSETTSTSSGRMQSIQRQMSLSLRQESALRPQSVSSLSSNSNQANPVWGWLQGEDSSMPNALLEGAGLAIGSSKEGFEARRHALCLATSETGSLQDTCPSRRLAEVSATALAFLEVPDGRISRLHCMIRGDKIKGLSLIHKLPPAYVEDQSANGTFLNGERLSKGELVPLKDGDRLSLILSLSPMLERSFVFHMGEPKEIPGMPATEWADTSSLASTLPGVVEGKLQQALSGFPSPSRGLKRMATSRYTTADSSLPGDMMCQICLGPLRACLALKPCGHNFCAACLSHHFASLLQVVSNESMRQLVSRSFPLPRPVLGPSPLHSIESAEGGEDGGQSMPRSRSNSTRSRVVVTDTLDLDKLPWHVYERSNMERSASQQACEADSSSMSMSSCSQGQELRRQESSQSDTDDEDGGSLTQMSSLCPLWDTMLPLDAASLKGKQVEHALRELQSQNVDKVMAALEVLARLAWSDDEVRVEIAKGDGIEVVVCLIQKFECEAGLLCNACLCLMSLVRGEGPACEANQWQVSKAGGVEAVVHCMTAFPGNGLVQLSALLCLIPLALDNPSLQAHVATIALPSVVAALRAHAGHADVQAKGLVVLGVLGQGEDAVHDAIRQQQLAVGATGRILAALREWGAENEEVLWAVLFSLAVLVRDGADPFQPAIRAVAAAGIPPLLSTALQAYKEQSGGHADEMIVTAGDYMLATLAPAAAQVDLEGGVVSLALAPVLAASAVWAWRQSPR